MVRRDKTNYVIQSVSHSLDVLEEFCRTEDEIGVTDLSKRLKLHKNNVFRLLATLEERGYIEQNKTTENYRLGLRCLQLGQTYIHQVGFLHVSQPILQTLVKKSKESAFVALRKGMDIIPLSFVEAKSAVRVVSFLGDTLPLHCTAPGKIHLTFESEEFLKYGLPENLARYTTNTIVDRSQLLGQFTDVSREGYAVDFGEYLEDVRCISVPVRDYTRSLVGSLSVAGPAHRLPREKIDKEIAPLIISEGKILSKRLGFSD